MNIFETIAMLLEEPFQKVKKVYVGKDRKNKTKKSGVQKKLQARNGQRVSTTGKKTQSGWSGNKVSKSSIVNTQTSKRYKTKALTKQKKAKSDRRAKALGLRDSTTPSVGDILTELRDELIEARIQANKE